MRPAIFYVTAFRGLGRIAVRELRERFGPAVQGVETCVVRDYDVVRFAFSGQASDLLRLGTAEDLFSWISEVPLAGGREDLSALQAVADSPCMEPALALARALSGRKGGRRTLYRVVVQARDVSWRMYRRPDMQAAFERGIRQRYPNWKPVPDGPALEFWVQQADRRALVGLRLSDRTMRHRTYKVASLPGSLRPTIARALCLLTGVEDRDAFLDPVCGAGTLLVERALAGRHRLLVGGDLLREAVRNALENFGRRHRPRAVLQWDALRLPLRAASIDKVAANLPWGRRVGAPAPTPALYAGVLGEVCRVLRRGGRAVFLTGAPAPFEKALRLHPGLKVAERIEGIAVLGRRADIFVLYKTS